MNEHSISLNYYHNAVELIAITFYFFSALDDLHYSADNSLHFIEYIDQNKKELYKNIIKTDTITKFIDELYDVLIDSDYSNNIKPTKIDETTLIKTSSFYEYVNSEEKTPLLSSFKHFIKTFYKDYLINGANIAKCNILSELNKPLIFLEEAIFLIKGYKFSSIKVTSLALSLDKNFQNIRNTFYDSAKLKEIKIIETLNYEPYFSKVKPKDFLKWALKYNLIDMKVFNDLKFNIKEFISSEGSFIYEKMEKVVHSKYTTDYIDLLNLAVEEFYNNYTIEERKFPEMKLIRKIYIYLITWLTPLMQLFVL